MRFSTPLSYLGLMLPFLGLPARAEVSVKILDVPDYTWHAGCFGTANGNLMGFWDRNGFTNFYTGPTGGGMAPLNSSGANASIRGMWASEAGVDGRPSDRPGHMNDYYVNYESVAADPYVTAGRAEHSPDCIGDFIGLNQKKWGSLAGECSGNIDGYSFVYWDKAGGKRVNYTPPQTSSVPVVDIQSGLRAWTRWRGYDADVFTQLTDFNPETPPGTGFTFEDLKAEINAGYPVLIFLQNFNNPSRTLQSVPNVNPEIHGMLIYGYQVGNDGEQRAYYKTSWGISEEYSPWTANTWQAFMPVRGVIGFRPKPKIVRFGRSGSKVSMAWDGPAAQVHDEVNDIITAPQLYVVEKSTTLVPGNYLPVTEPSTNRTAAIPISCCESAFFRIRLQSP